MSNLKIVNYIYIVQQGLRHIIYRVWAALKRVARNFEASYDIVD